MLLPEKIKSEIEAFFHQSVSELYPVSGGDINKAGRLKLENGDLYFIKWNTDAPADMFETEAKGLELLQNTGSGLLIPAVHFHSEYCLVTDWIEQSKITTSASAFGKALAMLHKSSSGFFGLDFDNYIGRLPQSNNKHSNWFDFFAIERIEPQLKAGVESAKLQRDVLVKVEKLYAKLGHIMPAEKPALIHGDLWSGNYMYAQNGRAAIFDPAVYYGHREMDIAMSRLFGGFSSEFYRGYEEEFPLEPGFETRKDLFNLYPILVHVNLFGGSYCRQAEDIINRYT